MLSTTEVAKQMGVAYTTVMLWIKQGKLEAVRRKHPRGDYYEISPKALKRLDRGRRGRPKKQTKGEAIAMTSSRPSRKRAAKKSADVSSD